MELNLCKDGFSGYNRDWADINNFSNDLLDPEVLLPLDPGILATGITTNPSDVLHQGVKYQIESKTFRITSGTVTRWKQSSKGHVESGGGPLESRDYELGVTGACALPVKDNEHDEPLYDNIAIKSGVLGTRKCKSTSVGVLDLASKLALDEPPFSKAAEISPTTGREPCVQSCRPRQPDFVLRNQQRFHCQLLGQRSKGNDTYNLGLDDGENGGKVMDEELLRPERNRCIDLEQYGREDKGYDTGSEVGDSNEGELTQANGTFGKTVTTTSQQHKGSNHTIQDGRHGSSRTKNQTPSAMPTRALRRPSHHQHAAALDSKRSSQLGLLPSDPQTQGSTWPPRSTQQSGDYAAWKDDIYGPHGKGADYDAVGPKDKNNRDDDFDNAGQSSGSETGDDDSDAGTDNGRETRRLHVRTRALWSKLDEQRLLAYKNKMGMKWDDICRRFPDRTPGVVEARWYILRGNQLPLLSSQSG
ncbi:hypothetical protein K469DRAFT_692218 [Zopfia rhizophila CBS 207.26]|uniref:Uncharacterized protein n=1 Tax=Zopfia rhizophila CBS 207.26 TaxID=1314779 RepID=A0A6A6DPG7_9PEZI|nr:hypothetical protein K469DRAFT_692218 [Zopfia rhizophila CBS 207.26]